MRTVRLHPAAELAKTHGKAAAGEGTLWRFRSVPGSTVGLLLAQLDLHISREGRFLGFR